MLNLTDYLNNFKSTNNIETPTAIFMTNLPWISPEAYLNIMYKPASPLLCADIGESLRVPRSLNEFYKTYNGVCLFLDGLRIYGCVPEDNPLDRSNPFALPPFDIKTPNEEFDWHMGKANLICIGSYGYDRSMVCMDRNDQSIICFKGTNFSEKRKTWANLDTWIKEELIRIGRMFSADGHSLVQRNLMIPGVEN
jgi:hypothetical protein